MPWLLCTAFPLGVLDPARLRRIIVSYWSDPVRAWSKTRCVRLVHVFVIAACVCLGSWHLDNRVADRICHAALRLRVTSCMRAIIPLPRDSVLCDL